MDNLEINIFEDLGITQFVIRVDNNQYNYGAFVLSSKDELIDTLLRFTRQIDLVNYTFPEIINACTFLSADEKEYYKLKFG